MDAVIALSRLGGAATHAELLNAVGRPALRRALDADLIRRVARNTYVLADTDRARVAAISCDGALALVSAALAHGWKVKAAPQRPQLYVPRNRHMHHRWPGIELRYADLSAQEAAQRVTSPVRTVVDCARFLAFDEALAIADSALRCGEVGERELMDAAEAAPRTGRAKAIRVAAHATGLAANPMESVLRAICLDLRCVQVRAQVWATDTERVDLADEELRLVIEAESMEFHGTREGYRRDVRRYTSLVQAGYLVLRFCWEDIMLRPTYVAEVISDVAERWASRHAVRREKGAVAA